MDLSKYNVKVCNENNIDEICLLQEGVFEDLNENLSILRKNTKETFLRCMKTPNMIIGLFDGSKLIGLSILEDARGREDDLGNKLCKHDISSYTDLKLIMIRKKYYGNGFQRALMWLIEKKAYQKGYHYLCTSVSPNNQYSKNNILKAGYTFDSITSLYGGLEREIYVKELSIKNFNRTILQVAGKLEGIRANNDLITEGIELSNCFIGTDDLATTGDIIEYSDINSGKMFYGLFIDAIEQQVLLCNVFDGTFKIFTYSHDIEGLQQTKVLLNTTRHEE